MQLWDVRDPATPRQAGPGFAVGQPADLGVDPSPQLVFSTSGRMLAVARVGGVQLFDVSVPAAPRAFGPPLATGSGSAGTVVFDRTDRALLTGMLRRPLLGGRIGSDTDVLPGLPGLPAPRRAETELVTWDIADPAAPRPVGPRIPYSAVRSAPAGTSSPLRTRWAGRMSRSGTSRPTRATGGRPSHPSTPPLPSWPSRRMGRRSRSRVGNAATGGWACGR